MKMQRDYTYNNSLLIVKFGDIIETETDVLVNSDDYLLPMKDGLSGYILEKGGQEIMNDVIKKRDVELGDVVVSTAGKLPHKFIFHCITVPEDQMFKNSDAESQESMREEMEEYVIRHSLSKCFRLLSAMDLESISIPCIGLNRAGFSFERVGMIMSEVIADFLLKTNKTYKVELCIWNVPKQYDMMDYIGFFEQFALRVPAKSDMTVLNNKVNSAMSKLETSHITNKNNINVFISYSHQDKEIAERICTILSGYGITYWIDREGVRHGDDFKEDIVDAIVRSEILLFISSANSNNSRNTIKEVSIAENSNKPILPVRIDDSPYNKSLEYDLCNRHWIQLKDMNSFDELGQELNDNIRFYLNRK
ncbi:MAG: TIR domain-containing protein [Bacteroidales bacterium]|nr:TIR domain-containing protein [Bacteroidales bacterium]